MTPLPTGPALDTERLSLRIPTMADYADSAALWADPEVTKHIGRPSTPEDAWARMLRYGGLWALLGYGYWTVRERETGRFVGEVGIADFRRQASPSWGDAPEAGWVVAPWAQGRGFATEAVRAALAWSDAHVDAPRTVCIITRDNAPSIQVAEKCGYREFGLVTYKENELLLFERPRVG